LMANPSGTTEVPFELKAQKSGLAEAQRLFADQLRKQTWRDDSASRLEALNRAQSLLEMEKAISPNDRCLRHAGSFDCHQEALSDDDVCYSILKRIEAVFPAATTLRMSLPASTLLLSIDWLTDPS